MNKITISSNCGVAFINMEHVRNATLIRYPNQFCEIKPVGFTEEAPHMLSFNFMDGKILIFWIRDKEAARVGKVLTGL